MRRIPELLGRRRLDHWAPAGPLGLSSLRALDPMRLVVRYEHVAPGEMLHIDTKKLGRIVRSSHRVTASPRHRVTVSPAIDATRSKARSSPTSPSTTTPGLPFKLFNKTRQARGIKHTYTCPYIP